MPHASAGVAGGTGELFARAREDVEAVLGLPVPPRPRAIVAPDDGEFLRRFAALTGGGAPPPGAVAIAFPDLGLILLHQRALLGGTDADLPSTLRHELAHLALGPLQRRIGRLPRWLEEGLAELCSGRRADLAERSTLGNWARAGALPRLETLAAAFPPHAAAGSRAYLVSLSFLAWVEAREGGGGARRLLQALARGDDLDLAFEAATGQVQVDAERLWADELAAREPLLPGFLLRLDVLSLAGVLALLAILRHVLRNRRLRAELAAADEAEDAARLAGEPAPPAPEGGRAEEAPGLP